MKSTFTVMSKDRWLQDPNGKWIIHFEQCNSDPSLSEPMTNIDTWGVMPDGAPSSFKSRRKTTTKASQKTLTQLRSNGWYEVRNHLGHAA